MIFLSVYKIYISYFEINTYHWFSEQLFRKLVLFLKTKKCQYFYDFSCSNTQLFFSIISSYNKAVNHAVSWHSLNPPFSSNCCDLSHFFMLRKRLGQTTAIWNCCLWEVLFFYSIKCVHKVFFSRRCFIVFQRFL